MWEKQQMNISPNLINACRRRPPDPVSRKAGLCLLLSGFLVLGSAGCRTPPLPEQQRQAGLDAEKRGGVSSESTRVRQEEESRTAPDVLALVQGELDEEAVVRVALINNPGLAAEYADLGIARSDLMRAARLSNPSVEASARLREGDADAVDIQAMQDLVDLALLPRRRAAASQSLDAVTDRLTSRILGVEHEARSAFSEYQTALILLENNRKRSECRDAAMDVARRMVAAGNMTALEGADFEQRYQSTQLELAALPVDVRNKREAVNRVMGLHEDTDWKAKPADDRVVEEMSIPAAGAERTALDASLELSAQRAEIASLAKQRGIENVKSVLPEVKVGVDSERDADGAWAVGPALVVAIPLFDQGQAEIAAADSRMQASWNRYAQTAVTVASATRTALTRMDASKQAMQTQQEEVVPLCKKTLQETLLQYNGMLVGVFDLLGAKEQELEAEARLAELTRDYRLARLDLQHLLAGGELAGRADMTTGMPVQGNRGKEAH
jgi:cobalt-zinc-cadmium efflux system outer membrane protein